MCCSATATDTLRSISISISDIEQVLNETLDARENVGKLQRIAQRLILGDGTMSELGKALVYSHADPVLVQKVLFYVPPGEEVPLEPEYVLPQDFLTQVVQSVQQYQGRGDVFDGLLKKSKDACRKSFDSRDQACDALVSFYYNVKQCLGPLEANTSPLTSLIGSKLSEIVEEGLDDDPDVVTLTQSMEKCSLDSSKTNSDAST
jgi:hypothetical protein